MLCSSCKRPGRAASGHDPLAVGLYLVTVAFNLAVAGVCIIKGKLTTGLIGIVVPVVAIIGALRLAKPSYVWARRRYSDAKLSRAQHRFGPAYQMRHDRLRDLLGGRPDPAGDDRLCSAAHPEALAGIWWSIKLAAQCHVQHLHETYLLVCRAGFVEGASSADLPDPEKLGL